MDIQLDWLVLLTFVVSLGTSILSGLSGGGGGFITTPYYIFIGLSPQEAVATGKMGAVGVSAGSVAAFNGKGLVRKKYLGVFLAITITCALIAAWLMPKIDASIFQAIIGWTLIVLSPTLFIDSKKLAFGERAKKWIWLGFVLYVVVSFGQTMMGAGIGTLIVLVLISFFGMGALEASATKRVTQLSQAIILFILLFVQGLVVLSHGLATMVGALVGGYIGSKFAIKKGEKFIRVMLAITMVVSGVVVLLIS